MGSMSDPISDAKNDALESDGKLKRKKTRSGCSTS
jgi:hypothetical protein